MLKHRSKTHAIQLCIRFVNVNRLHLKDKNRGVGGGGGNPDKHTRIVNVVMCCKFYHKCCSCFVNPLLFPVWKKELWEKMKFIGNSTLIWQIVNVLKSSLYKLGTVSHKCFVFPIKMDGRNVKDVSQKWWIKPKSVSYSHSTSNVYTVHWYSLL